MSDFIFQFYALICEMAPYLLLGFFIAGLLHSFVPQSIYSRYFAQGNLKSVILASLAGVPLPLCSCGVIPTASSMRYNGASKASTVSFLISTPQTGVDSIAATYSLMGGAFAIIRPIAAFITGIFGGLATSRLVKEPKDEKNRVDGQPLTADTCCATTPSKGGFPHRCWEALRYGFYDMVQDIGKNLIIGLIIGALIAIFVPDDFFSLYATYPILNMFLVLIIAIPMYVCATGSIPIAAALMFKGLSPGAALVFLMAGPAVNMASVMVIGKVLGRKSLIVYIASIIIGALTFGILIDYVMPTAWFTLPKEEMVHMCHTDTVIPLWQQISAWALLLMIVGALAPRIFKHSKPLQTMGKTFKVKGMNCNHCKANVEKAIGSVAGVTSVTVDLPSETAVVEGTFDSNALINAVESAGYQCYLNS